MSDYEITIGGIVNQITGVATPEYATLTASFPQELLDALELPDIDDPPDKPTPPIPPGDPPDEEDPDYLEELESYNELMTEWEKLKKSLQVQAFGEQYAITPEIWLADAARIPIEFAQSPPEDPEDPENPDNPDNPDNPEDPDNPDNPDNPEDP